MKPLRIALLAGRRRSRASLLMLSALQRLRPQGIDVAAVLAVSEFRWARIRDWYRRFGLRALTKGLRELGVASVGVDEEQEVLKTTLRDRSVSARSLPELCQQTGIRFQLVPDINGPVALRVLNELGCDLAVYSGAGILRQPLLDQFPQGVLNLHCGSLPAVRGMNGVEWNLFLGQLPEVTLHFIDAGIDTGRILAARSVPAATGDSLERLRGKTIVAGIELLSEQLPLITEWTPRDNPRAAGRQYFAMSETLKQFVQDRLSCSVDQVHSVGKRAA